MNITGNSTLSVIDNSLHFFVGEAIVGFQELDKQMEYLNQLVQLDSYDLDSAILSIDTTILNDTSFYNFSVEVSAQTDSYDPITLTFNFDFKQIIESLNQNPVSLFLWKE